MPDHADPSRATHPGHAPHDHAHANGDHEAPAASHDWNDEEFVGGWLAQHADQDAERRRRFALIRAVMPKLRDQEFRYLNLGAGPGQLDEVLLAHFPGAVATLVDVSLMMLAEARQRLERFGNRVEYVQANLGGPEWRGAVGDGFDFAISTDAIHHVGNGDRIQALYAEVYDAVGHGGIVLNLDRVRTEDPALGALAAWAAADPDAGLDAAPAGAARGLPPLSDHIAWLRGAGFRSVDVLWKDLSRALLFGVRDHFHMPQAVHDSAHAGAEGSAHSHQAHSHQAHSH
ncbi:MAG: class I SAM-dependent methyltransferase [Dehalococcoidia bacterium]|nr:class I SAM-dependent methyltransferase [Dehalococcoidia bacterium]